MMLSSLALGLWSMFLRVGQLWRLLCLFLFTFPRHAVRHSVLYLCWSAGDWTADFTLLCFVCVFIAYIIAKVLFCLLMF